MGGTTRAAGCSWGACGRPSPERHGAVRCTCWGAIVRRRQCLADFYARTCAAVNENRCSTATWINKLLRMQSTPRREGGRGETSSSAPGLSPNFAARRSDSLKRLGPRSFTNCETLLPPHSASRSGVPERLRSHRFLIRLLTKIKTFAAHRGGSTRFCHSICR